jgi:outer membrane protein
MKKMAFAAIFAALFITNVQAGPFFTYTPQVKSIGLYLGGQIWQSEVSGILGEQNSLIDFNLIKEQQTNYFIAVEHHFPLLPNARISSTTLDTVGKTNLTDEFGFDDEVFPINDNVNTSFNTSYVDYTLYYELLNNGVFSLDLGLTARNFDVVVTVTGTTVTINNVSILPDTEGVNEVEHFTAITTPFTPTAKVKADDIVPMLYVATNFSMPLAGLSAFAQGDFSLIGDHSLYDYQVGLSYDLVNSLIVDFNLTFGYRVVKMEFEDLNSLYTDLEFKGAFLGVIAHF